VKAHADVEVVLADATDHVLVGSDTGSLKRLGRDLLLLEGDCELREAKRQRRNKMEGGGSGGDGGVSGQEGDGVVLTKVNASGEHVHALLLLSDIKDLQLSLGHTTAVARLDVGLVLAVARALPRTCTPGVNKGMHARKTSRLCPHPQRERGGGRPVPKAVLRQCLHEYTRMLTV